MFAGSEEVGGCGEGRLGLCRVGEARRVRMGGESARLLDNILMWQVSNSLI